MKLRTSLTELVGVEHPVVQTGMGWVAGARLVSATANAGGLGILASATMTLDELAAALKMDPLEFRLKNLKNDRIRAVLEAGLGEIPGEVGVQ